MAAYKIITNLRKSSTPIIRILSCRTRLYRHPYSTSEADSSEPVKYTTSKAADLKFQDTVFNTGSDITPWYQPIVVVFSVGIFLLYFCVLREENDIDGKLSLTLYDHIEGLEEHQLQQILIYNKEKGLDTKDIEKRLLEIEQEKNRVH